ncbi:MAG TPA: hypothetical protein VK191_08660 [Symbiobacteriaceae bacterium]|nr:hypothetical protein [Symbiobacteriaceae bacterium]
MLKLKTEDGTDEIVVSSAQLIPALHQAKQELVKELESNLKQLKAVIAESNRVAKALESVLAEIQATSAQEEGEQAKQSPAKQKETSQGTDGGMTKQQKEGKEGKAKQDESDPSSKGDAPPETQRGQAAGKQKEDNPRQSEGKAPQWQPPEGGQ